MTRSATETNSTPADSLRGDILHMIALRSELAQLDLAVAKRRSVALGVALGVGIVLLLVGLSPCVIVTGELISQWLQVSRKWTLLTLGAGLILLGLIALYAAYTGIRRLQLFQASLDELREDLAWLREWRGGAEAR